MATTRRILIGDYWKAKARADISLVPHLELPTTPTPWLAFDLITRDAVVAQSRKMWPHAFVTAAIGGDQRANEGAVYYQRNMPGGTQNTTYGGFYRDRPKEVPGVVRPRTEPSWWILDRAYEVQEARAAGAAGFMVDWLNGNDGTGDNRMGQIREYCDGIRYLGVQNDFKMILMPDGTASLCDGSNFTNFVNKTAQLLTAYPDVFFRDVDGLWVIFPYAPECAPSTTGIVPPATTVTRILNTNPTATHDFWVDYIAALAALGFNVKLGMCYLREWTTLSYTAQALSSVGFMDSRWGDAAYGSSGSSSVNNGGAPAYAHNVLGTQWMHPVRPQDNRCSTNESAKYWEAGNSQNLINGFLAAIRGDADWIQNPTWSDIREHAHTMPSVNHGHCWLDLMSYFYQRWSTGFWPVIVRDNVFLSHRIHRTTGYTITGTQTAANKMVVVGGSTPVDEIEVIAQLTSTIDTSIEIGINGVWKAYGPSVDNRIDPDSTGVHRVTLALPASGTIAARVVRAGVVVAEITSPWTVTTTPVAQDMHYRLVGSLRGIE